MRRLVILLMACAACTACIKERRDQCPCYLHVDLSRVDSHYVHKMDIVMDDLFAGGGPAWTAVERRHIGDTLIMKVDKSEFEFAAWGNLETSEIDGQMRTISATQPLDSLWSYSRTVQTRCEDAYITVIPERQHIPVTIIVRGMLQGIGNIRPELGNISGSLHYNGTATGTGGTLMPVLVATPTADAPYYIFKTMMMTQTSATGAVLDLHFERDGAAVEATYPVGEMLLEIGEDISVTNQNPIVLDLTIGAASVLLTIKVNDWTRHGIFTITY